LGCPLSPPQNVTVRRQEALDIERLETSKKTVPQDRDEKRRHDELGKTRRGV
jgi:hypothetical protein